MGCLDKETQVIFPPGNVRYGNGTFSFARQQTAVYAAENAEMFLPHIDLFQITNKGEVLTYRNDNVTDSFSQWKESLTDDWFIPSVSQWKFLLSERNASTVSGVENARFIKCTIKIMVEGVPLWFVIIFVIGLILYLLKSVFGGFLGDVMSVLRGKMSLFGCLISTIVSILAVVLVVWCIFSELF